MIEPAIRHDSARSPIAANRLALSGQLMRFLALSAVAAGGLAFVYCLYGDVFAPNDESNQELNEIHPVTIGESSLTPVGDAEIPSTALTAFITQEVIDNAEHPLDPLLEMARNAIQFVEINVQDYSATIIKQVRWQGKLQSEEYIACKVRHGVYDPDPAKSIPFSVYTRFLKPKAGQEAIWVEGCNDDKLIAHGPAGLLNVLTLRLDPEGSLAMKGNRYTIRSIGMLNLIKLMLEKGERDLAHDDCEVTITRNIPVDGANCTRLMIVHHEQMGHFDFHKAEIYIDDERNLPIAYRAWLWPEEPGGKPLLLESYLYTDIKTNLGLTDRDFDPANGEYKFPGN